MIKRFGRRRTADTRRVPDPPAERFQLGFDEAPTALALVVGSAASEGYLLRANAAFARLLRSTPDALALREICEVIHPDDRERRPDVAADGTELVRARYLTADGDSVPMLVRSRAVRDRRGTTYFVSHVEPDTAVAQPRMNPDVVSTISDEVLTPLTSVQGYLEMVAEHDFGALSQEQQRLIGIAIRNAARIEDVVSDLLVLARLDIEGVDESGHAPVEVRDVLRAAVAKVGRSAAERMHGVRLELPSSDVVVRGDAALLERAVAGLIGNAVTYTNNGGGVSVSLDSDDRWARVTVFDAGLGIAPHELDRIADRFYRGSSAQHRAVAGTGLGLAIAKTIIEGHGGSLQITSELGVGTQVVVQLPLAVS